MASNQLPSKFRQVMVKALGTNFRQVTEIVDTNMPKPGPKDVIIRNRFLGINASDINFTAGRYFQNLSLPFPCGFEGIGEVVKAGAESTVKEGQSVVYTNGASFAEYVMVQASQAIPVPSTDPGFMSIIVSGLTASISLEKEADLKPGKTILVTAAAGGTGQFAVQLAKAAGCHVIGTCSNSSKVDFLKSIGCDRPINYKEEDLNKVLAKEYPNGIDVVYESVGKNVFDAALKNLALYGRLIVIGMISGYQEEGKGFSSKVNPNLPMMLLSKSASVRGFFLPHFSKEYHRHSSLLASMYAQGKIKVAVDRGSPRPFKGLEGIPEAIDYMYSGKNIGKIVVTMGGHQKSNL